VVEKNQLELSLKQVDKGECKDSIQEKINEMISKINLEISTVQINLYPQKEEQVVDEKLLN